MSTPIADSDRGFTCTDGARDATSSREVLYSCTTSSGASSLFWQCRRITKLIFFTELGCVLIPTSGNSKGLHTHSPALTQSGSGAHPPTKPPPCTRSTDTSSRVRELESEVAQLRTRQDAQQEELIAMQKELAVTRNELATVRQVVEAMRERLYRTPSHLRRPSSRHASPYPPPSMVRVNSLTVAERAQSQTVQPPSPVPLPMETTHPAPSATPLHTTGVITSDRMPSPIMQPPSHFIPPVKTISTAPMASTPQMDELLVPSPQGSHHGTADGTSESMEKDITGPGRQEVAISTVSVPSNIQEDVSAMGTQPGTLPSDNLGSRDWVPPAGMCQKQAIFLTRLTMS